MKSTLTDLQKRFWLLAQIVTAYYEQGLDVDTRLFRIIVPHGRITIATTDPARPIVNEHLVPIKLLSSKAKELLRAGKQTTEVYDLFCQFLRVARISKSQAAEIDVRQGLKTRMPDGWNFLTTDSVFARLHCAGIKFRVIPSEVDELKHAQPNNPGAAADN